MVTCTLMISLGMISGWGCSADEDGCRERSDEPTAQISKEGVEHEAQSNLDRPDDVRLRSPIVPCPAASRTDSIIDFILYAMADS